MLNSTQQILKEAQQASLTWDALAITQRARLLQNWAQLLSSQQDIHLLATNMVNYQVQQALELLSSSQIMPGPTGEINELSTSGRGVFVIAAQSEVPVVAIVGMISSALIAGNSIVLSLSESQQHLAEQLCLSLKQAGIDDGAVNYMPNDSLIALIKEPSLAGVAFMGNMPEAIVISLCLATRKGQIAQLVIETDLEQLSTITDIHLVFRFITEKTQTIDVTAIGGNAKLLALGCGDQ